MAFDASEEQHLFCSELDNDAARPEGSSHSNGNIWMDTEPARFQGCNSHSFAMEARMRLDHLKSGCNSPSLCRATDGTLYNYNCQRDIWDSEPKEEESALDLVELLDVGDDVQDEESWLYESPKRQAIVEKSESALRWCRRVLDNPSPEVEAACRQLINRLHENAKQSCQSPKLARLHQQVTQFKLLKLAQNQATSAGRTRSPARTSLRSLQAVRNSRSLDTEDCITADQISHPPSGVSSTKMGSSSWSPSLAPSVRDPSVRMAAMKRPERSQSHSPSRITQSAKGYLSRHGRVFASYEKSSPVAWTSSAPYSHR
ncbi:putative SLAIN motif-containing protein-like [Scophthalmus maximus]|uniref:Putative SLAIN motif-containing protein-like n=1 Tax=Scophthalmus maximus TaxID=52904 RepID=A0A2U9B8E1_SCOMX|nr:putative SLAIN motif-containing protein-like [Scophthalmus maximus]